MKLRSARTERHLAWAFACALGAGAAPRAQQAEAARPVPAGVSVTNERDATLARWRESLELDLPAEVVAEGLGRVDPTSRALPSGAVASGAELVRHGDLARDGEAVALVARALAGVGDPGRAEALLARAEVDAEPRVPLELTRARLALERDALGRALELTLVQQGPDAPVVRYPGLAECWLLAGRALERRGEDASAEKLLVRFVELAPHDVEVPAAWHMIAQAAIRRGDLSRANEAREHAAHASQWQAYFKTRRLQIREKPAEPLPRLGLAQLWLAAGEPARADTVLRELLAITPGFCRALALEGNCKRALGDAAAARMAWQRAIECDPKLSEPRYERALLAIAEKKPAEARADLEWLVAQPSGEEPRFLRAHVELARLLQRAGEENSARERYERYVALGGKEPL